MWHSPNRIHAVEGPIVTLRPYADARPLALVDPDRTAVEIIAMVDALELVPGKDDR